MGDSVKHRRSLGNKDLRHGSDEVSRRTGRVGHIGVDLGLDVEEDFVVGRALDEVEHLLEGGDLGTGVDLWVVSGSQGLEGSFTHPGEETRSA